MSSEKFCLRWNDFERNISSAFRDIREEKEFFDITLACDDEQLQAHKVILSACSSFFKNVLRRNHHQHPLLYLKGVSFRDMEAVLNFMYHGEVNVAQDDLNSFLQVAEDLRVKGLTQNNSGGGVTESKKVPKPEPRTNQILNPHSEPVQPVPAPSLPQPVVQHDDDIEEIVPVAEVKCEPHDTAPIQPVMQQGQSQSMAMYEDRSQVGDSMMMTMETEQYHDTYGGEYDGHYEDQVFDTPVREGGQDATPGKKQCPVCGEWYHNNSLRRHQKEQHSGNNDERKCEMCGKTFSSKSTFGNHMRRAHSVYKS